MRWPLLVIFAYLLAVVQTTLFEPRLLGLNAFGVDVRPDLLLLVAVFLALRLEAPAAFIAGWCLGFVEGLSLHAGEGPLGVTGLLFGLAAWLVCLVRPILTPSRFLVQVLLALGIVFAVRLPQQILVFLLVGERLDAALVLQRSLGDAVYSAVLAPYLFWVLAHTVERPAPMIRQRHRK